VTIVVPWSCLCSDNQRHTATIRAGKPLIVMGGRYREAKDKIRNLARRQVQDASPADGPLELVAAFWLPDRRVHDITNFAKIIADGLEGIIYANDHQLSRTEWYKLGVDVDAPRAEVKIFRVGTAC
jgi:Holliday junction resolvase RusA-like endonuclease